MATGSVPMEVDATATNAAAQPSATPQMVAECATSQAAIPQWTRDAMTELLLTSAKKSEKSSPAQ